MPCGCSGDVRVGGGGCSCKTTQAHGASRHVQYGGVSGGSSGIGMTYSSSSKSMQQTGGGGGASLHTIAVGQKVEMSGLNDQLAGFMQKIKDMCQSGASTVDPSKYHEMMRLLEAEINKLRNMYDGEINRLRMELQNAVQQASSLANSANSSKGAYGEMQVKLQVALSRASKAEDDLNNLHRQLAGKDKQIADLTANINAFSIELQHLRPDGNRLSKENEELRRQLELERKARLEAEAKVKSMDDKIHFDGKVFGEQQKDLGERIRAANEIIQTLEVKLKQLSNGQNGNLPAMLQRLRDGTVADMRKFQRETEEALTVNLTGLKNQMDEQAGLRERMAREKAGAEEQAMRLQARCSALEGEIQGLRTDNVALKAALDQEKTSCGRHVQELEARLREAQMQVMSKVKDYASARDAQASLSTEINQYRGLMDIGHETMRTCPLAQQNQAAPRSSVNASATWNSRERQQQGAMSARAPLQVPPSAQPYAQQVSMTSRTYGTNSNEALPTSNRNLPGCPPGPNCGTGPASSLPTIVHSSFTNSNRTPGNNQYRTTYGSTYNRKMSWN